MPINVIVILVVLLFFLLAFMLFRTLRYSRSLEAVEVVDLPEVDAERIAQHLAGALRFKTISVMDDQKGDYMPFLDLQHYLEETYPLVHTHLSRRRFMDYALLYTWTGSDPELAPIVLMAHQDVVPVPEGNLPDWEHPPFDGVISDGFVWGRGAQDIKNQLIAILETVEQLLSAGYKPERTIYLAFGHDEEIGGKGAAQIAHFLQDQGIQLEAVLDEGGAVVEGLLPSVDEPVGMVGISEKGFMTLKFHVESAPGHSSTPPRETAIGILSKALAFLEAAPQPTNMKSANKLFRAIGPVLPFGMQFALANQWLFGGTVRKNMDKNPASYAMIHTTCAPTIINAGVKENVLPASANAWVNFRIQPDDTIAKVCERVRKVIDDDRVTFEPMQSFLAEASTFSAADSAAYEALTRTIRQVFLGVPVAPILLMGATDSRNYHPFCQNVYRFVPAMFSYEDMKRVHGNNERIAVEAMGSMVQFFDLLIHAWAGPQATKETEETDEAAEEVEEPSAD